MKEYAAYLIFEGLSKDQSAKVEAITKEFGLEVDFSAKFLEFEYAGRDASNIIIRYFYNLAKIVGNAQGELICEIINDDGDNTYKFYHIKDGELIYQLGEIVRGRDELVKIELL